MVVENKTDIPDYDGQWEKEKTYTFLGLPIVIEYLTGDTRTKTMKNGTEVSGVMPSAYGRMLGTCDRHGEELDFYLYPIPEANAPIIVIDQIFLDNGMFDEHKVMLGFSTIEDAIRTYLEVFSDGSGKSRIGYVTTFPNVDAFRSWLGSQGSTLIPASKCSNKDVVVTKINGINQPRSAESVCSAHIDEAGGVTIELPSLQDGPKLSVRANEAGGVDYTMYLFSAISTNYWSNAFDVACRTLDIATEKDTFKIYIASRGGCVFLMGRLLSAIRRTKCIVETYAQGPVASAATAIWAEGHVRHILPGAFFMQHMSSQFLSGKTTDISAKTAFCVEYIKRQLTRVLEIGLFTNQEIEDMVTKSADIFISAREAINRVGERSGDFS